MKFWYLVMLTQLKKYVVFFWHSPFGSVIVHLNHFIYAMRANKMILLGRYPFFVFFLNANHSPNQTLSKENVIKGFSNHIFDLIV